jgi:uncharacterized membrane protein
MKKIPSDLLAAAILALATLIFTLTPLSNLPVRIPLGLLMVLFVPGYTLIAALFPKKADLEGIERTALSFGLSIAVVPLIGLGLNYTPWGIRLTPVVISLAIFTIAMAAAAYWRRMHLPVEERFSIQFRETISIWKGEILADDKGRLDKALTVILIITIFLSIAALVYVIVTPKQGEKFTEFYILGPGGKAYDYPTSVQAGNRSTVIVGVVNHEYALVNYTMSISLNNTPMNSTIMNNTAFYNNSRNDFPLIYPIMSMNLTLLHNETWERPVSYVLNHTGDRQKLEFLLYREGNFTSSYRDLHLWVNVSQNGLNPADEAVYLSRAGFADRK